MVTYWRSRTTLTRPVQGVGFGRAGPGNGTVVGPTITGLIDLRHPGANPRDALIIQEGAIPGALAAMLPGRDVRDVP